MYYCHYYILNDCNYLSRKRKTLYYYLLNHQYLNCTDVFRVAELILCSCILRKNKIHEKVYHYLAMQVIAEGSQVFLILI